MQNDGTATPSSGNRRKKTAFGALGVLVVAGVGVALFLPDQEPALSVPGRVCQEAVPGTHVKSLLPEKGEAFEEGSTNFMADAPKGSGKCDLSGGGRDFEIRYSRIQDPEFTRETVEGKAARPGYTPISLGTAEGYVGSNDRAALFVDCPYSKGRKDLLEVSVGVGGLPEADAEDSTRAAELSALTADVARAVARDVERCEGAADLPDSAPKIG
ncbi:hypothetical protein ACIREO_10815 [Streptomyces sp. NPDC102441]|uniref:hypothetical protein n=1 Tax=Streptomyces sp. NPDC102441 TaxID=3366176 RepID=UPI003802006A